MKMRNRKPLDLRIVRRAIPSLFILCALMALTAGAEFFEGAKRVTVSAEPGFYADPVTVELAYPDPDAEIHYTLDGSEPTATISSQCFLYNKPLVLDDASPTANRLSLIPTNPSDKIGITQNGKNYKWTTPVGNQPNINVLRARAFKGTLMCTNEFTGTWLVGATVNEHRLRVVSLITDENNFFGYDQGIMVPGAKYTQWSGSVGKPYANYFQSGTNWERRVHLELFETNREQVVNCDVGVRVHGAWSRAWPQKTLCIYARDEYGKKRIKHPLFPDDVNTEYKRFLLRNSGNDWNETTFRDAVSQSLFRPVAKHSTQGYVPAVVYINGEYWGIQNFRHQYSARFFEREFGADPDNVDYVKWAGGLEAAEGDLVEYNSLIAYMNSHSAADTNVYAEIQRRIDLESLIDYCILHTYLAAGDWANNNNNVGLWRERVAYTNDAAMPHDGRWRFCSYDTDSGTALAGSASSDSLGNANSLPMFKFLINNSDFKNAYVNRYADLINTVLLPERAQAKVDAAAEVIAHEIPRHVARWPNLVSAASWTNEVTKFRKFFADRPGYVRNFLTSRYSAGAANTLTLCASGHGRVQVNTLASDDPVNPLALPWSGKYFANIPVTLQASPELGWEFVGWEIGGVTNSESTLSLKVTAAQTATAVFREMAPPKIAVNEVMADSSDQGDWFELYNAGASTVNLRGCWLCDDNAKHMTRIPCDVEIAAGGFLVVRTGDGYVPGLNEQGELVMSFGLGKKGDAIHLYSWDGETELAGVTFGAQTTDVAEGLTPDGGESWGAMGVATPGAPNRGAAATGLIFSESIATQMWAGAAGRIPLSVPAGAVSATGFVIEGGEEFRVQLRNGTNLWWRVPGTAAAGTRVVVKLTWEGTVADETVTDETTYIISSRGRKPVVPAPAPEPIEEVVFGTGDVWGPFNKSNPAAMTFVTTQNQLAFKGAKLEEFLGCDYWGWMDGLYVGDGLGKNYFLHPWYDASGKLEYIVAAVQKYDDKHIKGVIVKLSQGEDGVYVQGLTAIYRTTSSGNLSSTDFVGIKDDGMVNYQNYTELNTIATNPSSAAYGLACFNAMKWLKAKSSVVVYPGGTLDDVKDCEFTAVMAGASTSPNNFTRVTAQNVQITCDDATGKVTKIRMEMQLLSDGYIKCVVVELTNGTNGVQAQAVASRYISDSTGSVGYSFVKSDGSYAGNSGTIAENPTAGGYGVAGLRATRWVLPPPRQENVIIFR